MIKAKQSMAPLYYNKSILSPHFFSETDQSILPSIIQWAVIGGRGLFVCFLCLRVAHLCVVCVCFRASFKTIIGWPRIRSSTENIEAVLPYFNLYYQKGITDNFTLNLVAFYVSSYCYYYSLTWIFWLVWTL